jgi:hypothetical protein
MMASMTTQIRVLIMKNFEKNAGTDWSINTNVPVHHAYMIIQAKVNCFLTSSIPFTQN